MSNDAKLSTSKKLTWVIIIFYIIAFASIEIAYIKYNKELSHLLNYVLPLAMTVVLSYFGKSGFENYNKIKLSKVENYMEPEMKGGENNE